VTSQTGSSEADFIQRSWWDIGCEGRIGGHFAQRLADDSVVTTRAAVRSVLGAALAQTPVATFAYVIVGVPGWIIWAGLTHRRRAAAAGRRRRHSRAGHDRGRLRAHPEMARARYSAPRDPQLLDQFKKTLIKPLTRNAFDVERFRQTSERRLH
jgi:hypothetical protein